MYSKKKELSPNSNKNKAIRVTVDINEANLLRNTQRNIPAILANEETAAKLENLEARLNIHLELIEKKKIEIFSEMNLNKFIEIINLNWPDSLKNQIKDCLNQKIKEIVGSTKNKSKD